MKIIKTSWIGILAVIMSACYEVPEQHAASDKYRLVWNEDPTKAVTLAWDQLSGENVEVYFGLKDHKRKYWKYKNHIKPYKTDTMRQMNTRFAILRGLKPDAKYYFVLKDEQGVSERYWFRTAPGKPVDFTFIGGGDTKSSGLPLEAGRASNKMVAKLRPLFVFFVGDYNSDNGTNSDYWKQWLTDWHTLTTTEDGRMFPIMPVHGNHESGDNAVLSYIFDTPYQSKDSSHIYYSLSFGGDFFHVISLNSIIETGKDQQKWLEEDLKKHKDHTFKIAGYHKPFWPHTARKKENYDQYNHWAHLFFDYGINISFDADSHVNKFTYPLKPDSSENSHMGFLRDDMHGTLYVGEGSWGARPRKTNDDKPWTLSSSAVNQFKWCHVHTESGDDPAFIDIYTVVTAEYDDNGELITYVETVESLTEDNLFNLPENIKLDDNGGLGSVIKFPFALNEFQAE